MSIVKPFLAGFLSTLAFHQGLLALLHAAGSTARTAYSTAPAPPFGVPQVLSLAFWGGVWGIVLWRVLTRVAPGRYWLTAVLFGAIAPTLVALFVVLPLRGMPVAGGGDRSLIVGALLLNAAWGAGAALLMRLFGRRRG